MAKVNICNIEVKDNPCSFKRPFQFEITFESIENLTDDLEWKIIYVGSAESEDYDQILDTVIVGPIVAGRHMFVFEADSPDVSKLPREDVIGVTVILLTCTFKEQEFVRVGYYVNNEYTEPELRETPPLEPDFDKLQRNILATSPRVTRFKIDWGDGENAENYPPSTSLENDSNQGMMVENNKSQHGVRDETMDTPLKSLASNSSNSLPSPSSKFLPAPAVSNFSTAIAGLEIKNGNGSVSPHNLAEMPTNVEGEEAMQL